MGPKKKPEEEDSSVMEMLRGMKAEMASMNEKLGKIDSIDTEVRGLKILLNDLKTENKQLKSDMKETEKKLKEMNDHNIMLENRLNSLEQHHRAWSARVMNIPLSSEEESDNKAVADKLYNLLFLPILQGALEMNLIGSIPTVDQLIEIAHILPGKAGEPKPVIVRFYNRNIKDIIFRIKKLCAPREETGGARGAGVAGGQRGGGAAGGRGGSVSWRGWRGGRRVRRKREVFLPPLRGPYPCYFPKNESHFE